MGADEVLAAPPDPRAWRRLRRETFAAVAAHLRLALRDVADDDVTPSLRRLRSMPAAKLVRGPGRRMVLDELARGGPLWLALRTRLRSQRDVLTQLADQLSSPPSTSTPGPDERAVVRLRDQRDQAVVQRDAARAQLRDLRAERDEAVRARDGAVGREASLRATVDELTTTVADLRARLEALQAERAVTEQAVAEAVAREQRRAEGAQQDLLDQLSDTRRKLDEARRAKVARQRRRQGGDEIAADAPPPSGPTASAQQVVAGRPSRLPPALRTDTRQGAHALLAAVPRVYVDGYNVTRTNRPHLGLAEQRRWLVEALTGLAARMRLEVMVVFDAHTGGAGGGATRRHNVWVQYTTDNVTADDELVFAVAALAPDEPVVVVTDDAELRARLGAHHVDLLHTAALAWLL